MKCPHCSEEMIIPENVETNMASYGNTVMSITRCCNRGVNLMPYTSYIATKYHGHDSYDDWFIKIRN